MMTSAQVVETSVNVTSNSPSQDYTHPDDHNLPNYDMTPGFKPFTKESGVAVAFGPITIGVKLYFWFERESMRRATRMCTSTLNFMAK